MRAVLSAILIFLVVGVGVAWWLRSERRPPQAVPVAAIEFLGSNTPIDIDIRSDGPGFRSIVVRLQATPAGAAAQTFELMNETYPSPAFLTPGVTSKRLHLEPDLLQLQVPEGQATLEVIGDTYAWHLWTKQPAVLLSTAVTVDLSPPRIELLTTQHNLRLGGAEVAVFRQSPDTIASSIEVDKYSFPSTLGYFADASVALAFFAVPQDLNAEARPLLVARDAAGNRREVPLPCRIKPREFAERTLAVDDAFLARKVPELVAANGLPPQPDPVQGYLYVNGTLRQQNESQIREATKQSSGEALWDGEFHRQSNAAPLSSFADRRSYSYRGEVIDHQTHLGYDLASLRLSRVEAAQNGIVVFAGNLGIYGNTVIVDHGLGISSLYGHMSTITVGRGDAVKTGQTLGQTGESGLAGGDHLHFSVILRGTHIDPVEWWDAHWLKDHVTPKLTMFPRAKAAEPGQNPS